MLINIVKVIQGDVKYARSNTEICHKKNVGIKKSVNSICMLILCFSHNVLEC